jgi:hypothetical protein
MEGIDMRNVLITGFVALLLWNVSAEEDWGHPFVCLQFIGGL